MHYQAPESVVAYYQQVGRAGRALDGAYGVLLSGTEETASPDYFIASAFPTRDEVQALLDAFGASPRGSFDTRVAGTCKPEPSRVDKAIALLSLESPAPLARVGSRWQLTAANLSEEFWERAERLTELRRYEQQQMQEYVALNSEHMAFLIRALDGDPGSVREPPLSPLPTAVDPALVREALTFLRRTNFPIEPRKQWPAGGMPQSGQQGAIPESVRALPGKALCVWGDAGWGRLVREGKYRDGRFGDELVDASAALVRDWNLQPSLAWVTCIPSRRHPELVPRFAQLLAQALGLPFHPVLEKTDDRPEQKTMANSTYQARNVDGSLAVRSGGLPSGPVLLVDDLVDSRWTLTVAAWLLRSNGSGEVLPFAIALAGGGT